MTERERKRRDAPVDLSLQTHRRIIGTLGLMLPALIYLFAGARPTADLPAWRLLGSVSAYYYTGGVGVFVGVLFALSLFLFSYRGYEGVKADRIVGTVGGTAALVVALFPTHAPVASLQPGWWAPPTGIIHYVAAVVLFGAFILFSVWLFRRSATPRRRDRPADKRLRDDVCLVCGLVMIAAVIWAAALGLSGGPIFLPEAVAIVAFAVSWLVKGEAYVPVVRATRRLVKRS